MKSFEELFIYIFQYNEKVFLIHYTYKNFNEI